MEVKIHPIVLRSAVDTLEGIQALQFRQDKTNNLVVNFTGEISPKVLDKSIRIALDRFSISYNQCSIIINELP
jgi:hypothetical protein